MMLRCSSLGWRGLGVLIVVLTFAQTAQGQEAPRERENNKAKEESKEDSKDEPKVKPKYPPFA
jgi:hypothetical protein